MQNHLHHITLKKGLGGVFHLQSDIRQKKIVLKTTCPKSIVNKIPLVRSPAFDRENPFDCDFVPFRAALVAMNVKRSSHLRARLQTCNKKKAYLPRMFWNQAGEKRRERMNQTCQ